MYVSELEGAGCSPVPEPGMYPLANRENVSWRGAGRGGIGLVSLPSAENASGSVPYL